MASASSPGSSSFLRRFKYDVFLSFRGEDTRKNFTDHLYFALKDAGIYTFRDDNELRQGEDISTELLNAIQDSRISLIVFSRNYADSRWCLEEVVKIMECRKTDQQLVLPIFYDVDPSDVRKQIGSFAEAFAKHEKRYMLEMDKVDRWRTALTEAANLSGWDLKNSADGHEAKFIKKIVAKILSEVNHTDLNVAIYPVGIDSRVQNINLFLSVGSDDVRIVGICGMGGMGKTTLAKAVYNQFFHIFEGKSFLANVREISKQPNGHVRLQEQLLSNILKTSEIKISSVDMGMNVIKARLHHRRVLVILDDVDQLDQLNTIARKRDWFGPGSRIIITTRDKQLLTLAEVDEIYMARELNATESLELFSWHAFRKNHPAEDYVEFSKSVVAYSGGLPLALEVLGSYLFSESVLVWESALEKLKRIPHDQILNRLRISFDALSDDEEKNIFLDIACFFIGTDKNNTVKILDGCGFSAEIGIRVLVHRCLVTISENNELMMHDLLRDMGREIVRKISKEPGKHSRLWLQEDVIDVLTKHTGTEAIEGLILNFSRPNEVDLSTEAFAKMQKLRLLQLNYIHLTGSYEHLSNELVLLCWDGFPLKFIPKNFHQGNLVAIDMQYSNLRQVWKDIKFLKKLKFLNLSHSHYLIETPDFSKLPNLEQFILEDCTSLVEIHQSIGHLDRLAQLNMKDCKYLKNLPRSIYRLKSLEVLILSGCSRINTLLEDLGEMESLTTLLLDATAIRQVPFSIVRLKNLRILCLSDCKGPPSKSLTSLLWSLVSPRKNPNSINLLPASVQGLNSLTILSLVDCNILDDAIPIDLGSLSSLQFLDLRRNNFRCLPTSLSSLSKLWTLCLDNCTRLQVILELPTSLYRLYARDCTLLERICLSKFSSGPMLALNNCHKLVEVLGLEKSCTTIRELCVSMEGCNNLTDSFKKNLLKEWCRSGYGWIYLPGNDIPDCFNHKSTGPSLSFEVPFTLDCKLQEFTVCFLCASTSDLNILPINGGRPILNIVDKTKDLGWTLQIPSGREDHLWFYRFPHLAFDYQLDGRDEVEVVIEGINVKKSGVYLLYENEYGEMIQYASSLNQCQEEWFVDDDHEWIVEDRHPKRLRYDLGTSMNIEEE